MGGTHWPLIVGAALGLLLLAGGLFFAQMQAVHAVIGTTACLWIIASAVTAHHTEKGEAHDDHRV